MMKRTLGDRGRGIAARRIAIIALVVIFTAAPLVADPLVIDVPDDFPKFVVPGRWKIAYLDADGDTVRAAEVGRTAGDAEIALAWDDAPTVRLSR